MRSLVGDPLSGRQSGISSRRSSDTLWLIGALIGVALIGLPNLLYPFHPDHAMFAYIGDRWLHGELPYRDAWDVKPPGIFAVYALSQALFGRSMAAARWADLLATCATAAGLFVLARRQMPAHMAVFAPLLFGLTYFTGFDFQDSAQSESFAAPLTVLYVYALLRSRDGEKGIWPAAAGFALGCMALLKTTYLLYVFLLPMALRRPLPSGGARRPPVLVLIGFGIGCLLPLGLTLLYFWHHGALGDLRELLVAQKAYGAQADAGALARGMRSAVRFFRERPVVDFLCLLALASLLPACCGKDGDRVLVWGWLGIAAGMVALQWRCHSYHFLVLLPPLALRGGASLSAVGRCAAASPRLIVRSAALVFLVLTLCFPLIVGMRRMGLAARVWSGALPWRDYWACFAAPGWYPFANSLAVAEYVRQNTTPEDPVLVYDYDPAIYYLAERTCPTRHLSSEPLIGRDHFPAALRRRWREQQIREVAARPPRLLVVGGCPHCMGLTAEHTFAPARLRFADDTYEYVTHITKDRIYRRLLRPAEARHSLPGD